MADSETPPFTAVFWDIENVHDEPTTHVKMTEAINEKSRIVRSYAFADWDTRRKVAENLHQLGYDLIHVPDSKDNAADYKMAAYILEHMVRYPETQKYVMVSGDGDFKLLAGALRERGYDLWVISNPIITASELTDIATEYSDIFSFRSSALPCSTPEDCEKMMGSIDEMREIAAIRLQEAISAIGETGNKPGVGHVKHVMQALNPTFNERIIGFRNWNEFLDWAEYEEYVKRAGALPATILTIPENMASERLKMTEETKGAFKTLCQVVENKIDEGEQPTLEHLKKQLNKEKLDFSSLGYPTLADFILAAEKRGYVRVVEREEDEPIIIPDVTGDRLRAWFEENVTTFFGESAKVPKKEFLEKIARLLWENQTTLKKLETYLKDEKISDVYQGILKSSELLFLPPFQMCMVHVFLGQGKTCEEVVQLVNIELEPLGIILSCPS
ncbi:MAG: NYN domain-containing protein [Candidatus Thorarchaeota archaeon]